MDDLGVIEELSVKANNLLLYIFPSLAKMYNIVTVFHTLHTYQPSLEL